MLSWPASWPDEGGLVGLVREIWLLLALGLRLWWNKLRRSSWRYRIGWLALAVILVGGAFLFAAVLGVIVRSANGGPNGADAVRTLPGGLLSAVFLFTFITAFGNSLSALYLAGDLDLLMAAPVSPRSVFAAKLIQSALPNYLLITLPLVPVFWAYGQAQQFGPAYVAAFALTLVILPILPVSVAALLVMVVVRLVPPRRVAEIMGLLIAGVSISLSLWGQAVGFRTSRLARPADILQGLSALDRPMTPPGLAGQGLVALGSGDWLQGVGILGTFAALSIVGAALSLEVAGHLYYVGWARTRGGAGRTRPRRAASNAPGAWARWLAHPIPAVVLRDFNILPRDLSNLIQILAPLAFGVFWVWEILRNPTAPRLAGGALQPVWGLVGAFVAISVASLIFARFGLNGISREGRAAWIIRAAPVSAWQWLWGKFLVAYLPYLGLGSALVFVLWVAQREDVFILVQSWLALALVGAGVTGISVGIGGSVPRFDWAHPQQMVGTAPGCLAFIAYSGFTMILLGMFAIARIVSASLSLLGVLTWAAVLSAALLLTLAAVFVPLTIAARRLSRLE
ncbi:MAG: hypothetical protein U0768_06795 [Anaerolineae bacterium]